MEWLLAAPQIQSAFSSLGSLEGDSFVVHPNALAILEEINYKLTYEDQTLRTFRRAIGFGQNVRADLIPLLENAKDEHVLDSVIRILVNLTVPVECLFSVDVMYRTEVGRHTIFELNKLLYMSKEAFTDPKSTKSVVEYMKHILESDSKLSPQKCDKINNCLLLLRNILHIPETNASFIMIGTQANSAHSVSMQNSILWNLFIQSIDKLLLYLMTSPQRAFWGVTMVQIIAIMYKDQHVSTLQKLLNMWFEASLSESSEDNESNTSPPKQGSGDSSPMLTSYPTSDSSDNGSGGSKNDCAVDRRHASLRQGTEATLQEVSRKGQEYKNSIFCVSEEKYDNFDNFEIASEISTADSTSETPYLPVIIIEVEAMEEGSDATDIEQTPFATLKAKPTDNKINTNKQPAKLKANTSNLNKNNANEANFMPPPALPITVKSSGSAQLINKNYIKEDPADDEAPPPRPPKVSHSGQLSLTKGKCCPQKRECPSSQSELSDCGYDTQVENHESISTSSNDDDGPQHQKPPCNSKPRNKLRAVITLMDKKELRRKKLVKRSKSSLINMKGLVQHTPTDEDISNLLKEFTVDFLLKGYGNLVEELHSQLLTNTIPIDTSHFFWLVTYFLKFAAQLELDMEHINSILTFDVISYLTFEGVTLCEQLELNSRHEGSDLKPYLRRMHLVVTAIREFLQAIDTYKKVTHLSEDDREHLRHLQQQISSSEDLRNLFVLLLRRFNPSLQTKQYLQDLVVTNHILLVILDCETQSNSNISIKMVQHVSQFATLEVMHFYGLLLEDFNNNGEYVNDCIFTMMHHVSGDLGQIATLFQPTILKTFSHIWEADYELCDDWSDLIEYVIHKFINTPQKNQLNLPSTSLTELTKEHNLENTVCIWSQEEMDTLYWYYVQSKKNIDIVGKIVELFSNSGNKQKSRISIIQQLLQQDIITLVEYDDLMKFEDAAYQHSLLTTSTSSNAESGIALSSCSGKPADDIQVLRDLIIKENKETHLIWLQKQLLECCYIKQILNKSALRKDHQNLEYIMEPVAYHCILMNKSIPVVQWNNDQAATMLYQPYVLLFHKLGLQLPADAGSIFVRIPDNWSAEMMYNLAKKLGPLDELLIKFDANKMNAGVEAEHGRCHNMSSMRGKISAESSFDTIHETEELIITKPTVTAMGNASEIFAVPKAKHSNSIIRFTPEPEPTPSVPNWLQLVMRSKFNTNLGSSSEAVTTTTTSTSTTTQNEKIGEFGNSAPPSLNTMTSAVTAAAAVDFDIQQPTNATMKNVTVATTTLPYTSINNIIGVGGDSNNSNSNSSSGISMGISSKENFRNLTTKISSSAVDFNEYHQLQQHQSFDQIKQQQQQQNRSDDDTTMKSLERNDSISSGICTRSGSISMDNEYSSMVAAAFEQEITNDSASVASDLTRMYVSDEDEKQEFRAPNYVSLN